MDSGEIETLSLRRESLRSGLPRTPRLGRRRLLLTCGSALVLALAVSGLLLSTQADPHAALSALLGIPSPTPTATLAPGDGIYFVAHRVPWGVLTVDRQRNDALDITQWQGGDSHDTPLSFLLTRGRHQVDYEAPPFKPLRCVVSVPASPRDTCPIAQPDDQSRRYLVGAARILDLGATFANLPAQPMAELTTAASAAISVSTAPVAAAAGEQYLGTDGQPHTFAQDAQATLFREPWTGAPLFGQTNCVFLCPVPPGSGPIPTWGIVANFRAGFHYTAAAPATTALADGPLLMTPGSYEQTSGPLVNAQQLAVTWDGSWHVTFDSSDPMLREPLSCQAASEQLAEREYGAAVGAYSPPMQPIAPIAAANPAVGCLTGLQRVQSDGTLGPPIRLLYRFGLLLTLDAAGSAAFPDLPHADAQEQALARQILDHAA